MNNDEKMWTIEFHPKAKEELRDLPESFRDKFDTLFVKIRDSGFSKLSRDNVKYIETLLSKIRKTSKPSLL